MITVSIPAVATVIIVTFKTFISVIMVYFIQPSPSISDDISGDPISYNFTFINTTAGVMCDSNVIVPESSCRSGFCSKGYDITSSPCSPLDRIGVVVFATNLLGSGMVTNTKFVG